MGKNNAFINQQKELKKQIDNLTPQIYSVMALALHRKYGWGFKRINDLFLESQKIWVDAVETGKNVVVETYDETGILTVSVKQAKRFGIELSEDILELYESQK